MRMQIGLDGASVPGRGTKVIVVLLLFGFTGMYKRYGPSNQMRFLALYLVPESEGTRVQHSFVGYKGEVHLPRSPLSSRSEYRFRALLSSLR
jgi:hypothetical protein